MLKIQSIQIPKAKAEEIKTCHYTVPGLLPPGKILALNLQTRTLSLLSDGPQLIIARQFSDNETRVVVPILESFPHYCPYEVLLAHVTANVVTEASINYCRQRLQEAQMHGTGPQELRPIRRALTSLRIKLHCFNLEISNIRERGCSLTNMIPS